MFELAHENKCWWPVDLPGGADENGEVQQHRILVLYRIFDREQMKQHRQQLARQLLETRAADGAAAGAGLMDELAQRDAQSEAELRERICDFKRVVDQNGQAVPFSAEVVELLMRHDGRFDALLRGLYEASKGARAKN